MTLFAYVDPGLGLLLWQAVVSAFLGVLFYLKKTRTWMLKPFQKLFRSDKAPVVETIKIQKPTTNSRA
jgi:hypothetical protein